MSSAFPCLGDCCAWPPTAFSGPESTGEGSSSENRCSISFISLWHLNVGGVVHYVAFDLFSLFVKFRLIATCLPRVLPPLVFTKLPHETGGLLSGMCAAIFVSVSETHTSAHCFATTLPFDELKTTGSFRFLTVLFSFSVRKFLENQMCACATVHYERPVHEGPCCC